MKKIIISEEQVKKILDDILLEQVNKVSRQDFSRIQFKIEELENSLNDTIKEFKKLQESIPNGLKNPTNKKIMTISQYLIGAQGNIVALKSGVRAYKRKIYSTPIPQAAEV